MANGKSDGTRRQPGISAWLSVGLALGWLTVLALFVRGISSLLTAWAATVYLVVLLVRRRSASLSSTGTADQPTAQTDPMAEAGRAARAEKSVVGRELAGEQEGVSSKPDHSVGSKEAADLSTDRSRGFADGAGTGTAPAAPVQPGMEESARTLGFRVLTAAEVASVLRVDVDAIILAIRSGELPGNRIGRDWRVDQDALARWLQGSYGNSIG